MVISKFYLTRTERGKKTTGKLRGICFHTRK